MNNTRSFSRILAAALICGTGFIFSCAKEDEPQPPPPPVADVPGCMDPNSLNYNPLATIDDGSCEYPEAMMPLAVGNYWRLTDQITLPIIGTTVDVITTIEMTDDTVINGNTYYITSERTNVGGFGDLLNDTWMYGMTANGDIVRIAEGDTTEQLFLRYPLTPGDEYYADTAGMSGAHYLVVSYNIRMDVPAGTFDDVYGIDVTDPATSITTTQYIAKGFGLIRSNFEIDLLGFPFELDSELDSLYIVP